MWVKAAERLETVILISVSKRAKVLTVQICISVSSGVDVDIGLRKSASISFLIWVDEVTDLNIDVSRAIWI